VAAELPGTGEELGVFDRNFPKNDVVLASQLPFWLSQVSSTTLVRPKPPSAQLSLETCVIVISYLETIT
jgi:hypothetical protein